jgi:hypothetical protein
MISAPRSLVDQLITLYGPTVGGRDLYSALGFKTYAAFHRSKQRREIGVNVFILPGRRGWFALTTDIANWLEQQAGAKFPADPDAETGSNFLGRAP